MNLDLEDEVDDDVIAYDHLIGLGFPEPVAVAIVTHAILQTFVVDQHTLKICAAACGYVLPAVPAFDIGPDDFKNRN